LALNSNQKKRERQAMAESGVKSKVGATPGKLLLIAVLAVVFVAVILFQFTGKEEPPPPRRNAGVSGRAVARPKPSSTRVPASAPEGDDVLKKERHWPKIALEEVLQHDPFAVPPALRPPEAPKPATVATEAPDKARREELQRQRAQALAAIRAQGVHMIFLGEEERVAIIGDRRVRVGDLFEGFRVTDIGSDGVTLSEQTSDEK
jgi:hypothetical protein